MLKIHLALSVFNVFDVEATLLIEGTVKASVSLGGMLITL